MILIVSDYTELNTWFRDIERYFIKNNIKYHHHHFYSNKLLSKLIFFWRFYFKILLKKYNPKVVVFIQHYGVRNQLIRESKRLNIPTVELQHGVIYPNHKYYFLNRDNLEPDYIITYSDYEKKLLENCYGSKIVPLGCPRYDKYKDIRVEKGIKGRILWAAQEDAHEHMDVVFRSFVLSPYIKLLVKFHPTDNKKEKMKYFELYKKKYNLDNVFVVDRPVEELIPTVDLVIFKNSTVGMESEFIGVPAFRLETNSFIGTTEKDRKEFIKERLKNFGNATEKIGRFLSESF